MQLSAARELYRRAELRLRDLLFGDSVYSAGRLRGEEPRRQAAAELRRMRGAFDEVVGEAEQSASRADLAEDLLGQVRRETSPDSQPAGGEREPSQAPR
jgi:hypothetical protein